MHMQYTKTILLLNRLHKFVGLWNIADQGLKVSLKNFGPKIVVYLEEAIRLKKNALVLEKSFFHSAYLFPVILRVSVLGMFGAIMVKGVVKRTRWNIHFPSLEIGGRYTFVERLRDLYFEF